MKRTFRFLSIFSVMCVLAMVVVPLRSLDAQEQDGPDAKPSVTGQATRGKITAVALEKVLDENEMRRQAIKTVDFVMSPPPTPAPAVSTDDGGGEETVGR